MDLFELLVYGFMFGAFLLFNFVSQQAARRRRQEHAEQARVLMEEQERREQALLRTGEPREPAEVDLAEESWGRAPVPLHRPVEERHRVPDQWGRASETAAGTPPDSAPAPPPWGRTPEGIAQMPEPAWRLPEPVASQERPTPFSYDTAAVLMREGVAGSRVPAPAPVRRAAQPAGKSRRFNRPALHSRQGLRDAVVAMTILGPCRALQPYQDPAGSGVPGRRPAVQPPR